MNMLLYVFKCEHGQYCNFFSDCKFCAKKKIDELQTKVEQLRIDAEKWREHEKEVQQELMNELDLTKQ